MSGAGGAPAWPCQFFPSERSNRSAAESSSTSSNWATFATKQVRREEWLLGVLKNQGSIANSGHT